MPSDIESSDWSEIAANNIQPAPGGWPPNSSPNIVYSNGREEMGATKRWWNRANPTVVSGGSANAQSLTYAQGPTAYVRGQTYSFIAGFTNAGATTLNVNGLGTQNVFMDGVALVGGEINSGLVVTVAYDGIRFEIISGRAFALAKTGGTMSGSLAIDGPSGTSRYIIGTTNGSTRWQLTLANSTSELGSNSGSDFAISRFNDAGSFLDTPLSINRQTSGVIVNTPFTVTNTAGGSMAINGPAGSTRVLFGNTANTSRWGLLLGNGTAEGGSNAGSDFVVNRYNDAGTLIDASLTINRASGNATFGQGVTIATGFTMDTPLAASGHYFLARINGVQRWNLALCDGTAESGSNAGSNLIFNRYSDAGAFIDTPLAINRASGAVTVGYGAGAANPTINIAGATATFRQLQFLTGTNVRWALFTENTAESGSSAGSNFGMNANNDAGSFLGSVFSIVRSTQIVSFAKTIVNGPSDRTLKENIEPLDGALDKVQQLKGVSFNFIKDADKRRQIGLVAQDVAPIVPEVLQDFQDFDAEGKPTAPKLAIDYTRLVPLLVEAIKELTAKVARLEAGLAAASQA